MRFHPFLTEPETAISISSIRRQSNDNRTATASQWCGPATRRTHHCQFSTLPVSASFETRLDCLMGRGVERGEKRRFRDDTRGRLRDVDPVNVAISDGRYPACLLPFAFCFSLFAFFLLPSPFVEACEVRCPRAFQGLTTLAKRLAEVAHRAPRCPQPGKLAKVIIRPWLFTTAPPGLEDNPVSLL